MSGQFEIEVQGKKGQKIKMTPVEKLTSDKNIEKTTETWMNYILKGDPNGEVWRPKFSYTGARWVQIEWATRDPVDQTKPLIKDVKGYFITSSVDDIGKFSTSDHRYKEIHTLVKKASESNLNHVHSDCPTIEKLGWLEPNHLMAPSIMYMKNVDTLWNKISSDMRMAQYAEEEHDIDLANVPFEYGPGLVPSVAPRYGKFILDGGEGSFWDIIPWGSSILLAAEAQRAFFGNRHMIKHNYKSAKKYVNYMLNKYENYNVIYQKEGKEKFICHGLGDWGIAQNAGESRENIETAFLYKIVSVLSSWAKHLGISSDEKHYHIIAEEILENYNDALLVRDENGEYYYRAFDSELDKKTQENQAIPIQFNMVPEIAKKSVENAFLKLCKEGVFRSGEIGLRFIFNTLSDLNRNDIVEEMIMQKNHPSYYRFIEKGETTLPEFWRDDARSRNHDMMGQIVEWFYSSVAGIRSSDGFKTIHIRPDSIGHLTQINCCYRSIMGEIEVHYDAMRTSDQLYVTIPPNATGVVDLSRLSDKEIAQVNGKVIDNTSKIELKGGSYKIKF